MVVHGKLAQSVLAIALSVLVVLTAGCGGSESGVTLSASRVRSVFAQQGLQPVWVFDSRTATEADINRIAPLTGKDPALRKASALARRELRQIVSRSKADPVTWLAYKYNSVPAEVFVWGTMADAESSIQREQAGEQVTGGGTQFLRIHNVAIEVPVPANVEPHALKAALAQLAKAK